MRLFEVGTRFEIRWRASSSRARRIAGLISGPALPEQWGADRRDADFYDLKSDVEALLALTGRAAAISYIARAARTPASGSQRRGHGWQECALGWLGQLQPETCAESSRSAIRPGCFELAIDPSFRSEVPVFTDISRFPAIRRDLAVVVDEATTLDELRESC